MNLRIALAWLGTSLLAAWLGAGCAAGGNGSEDLGFEETGGSEEPSSSSTTTMNGTGAHPGTSASTGAGGASNKADASTLVPSTNGRSLVNPVPTPPTGNTKFHFPQNRMSASCVYPFKAFNDDVKTAYGVWKSKFLTTTGAQGELRVQRAESGNDTVSEGIAYGMIVALYMGEQTPFDHCGDTH